jgi:putative transcriptional regulator
MSTTARRPLAERLRGGLEEGLRHARGEISLRTTQVPERPPQVAAPDVVRIRRSTAMSQAMFARLLNVSTKTVQSWEQGRRRPSQAALRMLQLVREQPQAVLRVVSLPSRRTNRRPRAPIHAANRAGRAVAG